MVFKSQKRVNKNQFNLLKLLKVDLTKLKRKSMKLKKTSLTSLVMKLLKLKRNLMHLDLRFKILKMNSKLIYLIHTMTTCLVKKLWILIIKSINTMLNCKLSKKKLNKTQNLKIYLS